MDNTIKFWAIGTAPLMMHSDQAVNPRNKYSIAMKEITSKRKKTEEDLDLLSQIEWESGLYWDEKNGYYLPERVISGALLASSKQFKLGQLFKQGVMVIEDKASLHFPDKDLKPENLFKKQEYVDFRNVRVQQSKVMRTRPIFPEWSVEFTLGLIGEKFNKKELIQVVENAGKYVGFGDYRPRYGRFDVEVVK